MNDVLHRFWAGDDIDSLSEEFGVPISQIEDVLLGADISRVCFFARPSLGRVQVPALLREAGLRLITLAERYGVPEDEGIVDDVWLTDAGKFGEAVFLKDTRVRYNEAEKEAIKRHRVRCFCLTRQDLNGVEMANRFLDNLSTITAACQLPGPFMYAVQHHRIDRLKL